MNAEHGAEIGLPTCPSECAETNHPGMEHKQWLPPEQEAAVMRLIEVVRPHWDKDTRPIPPGCPGCGRGDGLCGDCTEGGVFTPGGHPATRAIPPSKGGQ